MNTSAPTLRAPIITITSAKAPQAVERYIRKVNRDFEKRGLPFKVAARDVGVKDRTATPTVTLDARKPDGRYFIGKASLIGGEVIGDPNAPMPMSSAPNIDARGVRHQRDVVMDQRDPAVLPNGGPAAFNVENVRKAIAALIKQGGIEVPFEV